LLFPYVLQIHKNKLGQVFCCPISFLIKQYLFSSWSLETHADGSVLPLQSYNIGCFSGSVRHKKQTNVTWFWVFL